jgi:SAM-dependent methyltransferase
MDAVELPYVAQAHYLGGSAFPLVEYLDDPERFRITVRTTAHSFHIPAWRYDLLPSDFFDMVACVQVLPEIREDVLFHSLALFRRVLRPGGYLYIRDHAPQDRWRPGVWMPGHAQIVPALLPSFGFRCEFAPQWRDRHDAHGLPQIWRRVDSPRLAPPTVKRGLKAAERLIQGVRYRRYRTTSRYVPLRRLSAAIDTRATRAP